MRVREDQQDDEHVLDRKECTLAIGIEGKVEADVVGYSDQLARSVQQV